MEFVIEAVELRKRYGQTVALDGATLRVRRGLTALVGPNGAGKTTLIEGVLGLRKLDGGKVVILGEEVRGELPSKLAKRIGVVLEGSSLIDTLNVVENLELAATLSGVKVSFRQILNALDAVGARDLATRLYGKLSTGQRKRVDIAAALMTEPELLILDEPEAGLDPAARVELVNLLGEIAKGGISVLFSTHDLSLASRAWDVAVIVKGRIVAQGAPLEIAKKYGGRWRVKIIERGAERVFEVEDPRQLPDVLKDLGDAATVEVSPPDLFEAFKRLAGYA